MCDNQFWKTLEAIEVSNYDFEYVLPDASRNLSLDHSGDQSPIQLQADITVFAKTNGGSLVESEELSSYNRSLIPSHPASDLKESEEHDQQQIRLEEKIEATEKDSECISLSNTANQNSMKSQSFPQKNIKGKKIKKGVDNNSYPTKNFLPPFRSPFLSELMRNFSDIEAFNEIQAIKNILMKEKNKQGVSLKDFQKLLNEGRFRPYLRKYFKDRGLYRDLMILRVRGNNKIHFFKRIKVFYQAFLKKKFSKINY